MKETENWRIESYRWHDNDRNPLTWKQTLEAMCNNYGTFCGRWHSNEFWKATLLKIPDMSEGEARDKIIQIEREADADLAYWRMMQ